MITAFIPARMGSKRLEHKNMRRVSGVSLASLSVIQALELSEFERVVFSTDSPDYAEVVLRDVRNNNSPTERLQIHARDPSHAGTQSKIFNVLCDLAADNFFDSKFAALMLPTAPLRRRSTLKRALDFAINSDRTSFTACPYDFHVSFAFEVADGNDSVSPWQPLLLESPMITGRTRSQDQSQLLHPHGGLVVVEVSQLARMKTIYDQAVPIATTRTEGLDIDVGEDLDLIRCLEANLQGTFPFLSEPNLDS